MAGPLGQRGKRWCDVECASSHWLVTQKKTPVARERDRKDVQKKRKAFLRTQAMLDTSRLIFIDESGFRLGTPPHYGWAPRGEKSPGKSTQGAWKTMTMIGAMSLTGFRGFMTVDAPTDADVFRAFVEHVLVSHLKPGDIVVMDNLSAHRDGEALQNIRGAGADVLFLPPYSPEFNPIEKVWAKLKAIIRRADTLTREAFDTTLAAAMRAITAAHLCAWTQHAGYNVGPG